MPPGLVAESESRFDRKLSTLTGEKDTESTNSWMQLGKVGTESWQEKRQTEIEVKKSVAEGQ